MQPSGANRRMLRTYGLTPGSCGEKPQSSAVEKLAVAD